MLKSLGRILEKHTQSNWPSGFFDFEPVNDVPDFKALRKDLKKNVKKAPLAANVRKKTARMR